MGARVAERLTPRGPRFKPRPSRCFLRQETLLHFVSVHPGVNGYWRHTAGGGNPAMDQHPVQGEEAILLGMLCATETRISFGRLGLRLVCAFAFHLFTINSAW